MLQYWELMFKLARFYSTGSLQCTLNSFLMFMIDSSAVRQIVKDPRH